MNDKLQHKQNILTRGLPKTGQVTSYAAGDDGDYEAGWWISRLNANNKQRWITKTIGGDVIVLDRATGLMWAADGNAAGCNNGAVITWANAITYANGLNFAGFTDWRLPNINELCSIVNYALMAPAISEPPFSNTQSGNYWSSTTHATNPTAAWAVDFNNSSTLAALKTLEKFLRTVRGGI